MTTNRQRRKTDWDKASKTKESQAEQALLLQLGTRLAVEHQKLLLLLRPPPPPLLLLLLGIPSMTRFPSAPLGGLSEPCG